MDYNADWEMFGDRVGWRKDGNWLDYMSLSLFSLYFLGIHIAGIFPLDRGRQGAEMFSSLAQRIVECSR